MITAYQISYEEEDKNRYIFPLPHLFRRQAESHVDYLIKVNADDPQVSPVEISSISNQKIVLAGDVVGYQFSRTKMGKRTVTRKVYNLELNGNSGLIGEVTWKGRILKVVLDEDWFNWIAVR